MEDQIARRWLVNRLLAGAALSAPIIAATMEDAEAANILLENTLFLSGAAGATTKRTLAQRCGDVIDPIEFGCDPTGVADSTNAIRAVVAAVYATKKNAEFPAGNFKVTDTIDMSGGTGAGRISGAGLGATNIFGTVNNGFIVSLPNEQAGVQEISDMTITNGSTVLGTGAVRWLDTSTNSTFRNVFFNGQIGLDIAWNSFGVNILSCKAGPTTANQIGTVGIVSNGCNLIGYRAAGYDTAFMAMGNNGHALIGNSAEVCAIGFLLGMFQGWASACTISGNILTVGGTISPAITVNSTQPSFTRFAKLFGDGITGQVWGDPQSGPFIVDDHSTDGTLTGTGGAGTYRISASFSISTPQVMFTRSGFLLKAATLANVETEGCIHGVYVNSIQACKIDGGSLGGVVGEAPKPGGGIGLTAHSHLYISGMTGSTIENIAVGNGTYKSAIYIDSAGHTADCVIQTCEAAPTANAVSDSAATISGTTMTINSTVSGSWAIGMTVAGIGVSANTTITDFTDATHFVVSVNQNVSATTLTGLGGTAWTLPTTSSSAAGLRLNNSNNPAFVLTFSQLPGQVGVDADVILKEGLTFDISDGQKSGGGTAAFADIVAGGSAGHYLVRYNGTNWIRIG